MDYSSFLLTGSIAHRLLHPTDLYKDWINGLQPVGLSLDGHTVAHPIPSSSDESPMQ
jgi:hypothetical protein